MKPSNQPARPGQPTGGGWAAMPPRKAWGLFALILLVNYLVSAFLFPNKDAPITVPYTVFRQEVAKGNVTSIYSRNTSIEGRFKAAVTWPPPGVTQQPPTG